MVETTGLAGRVQGMRRYYALLWQGGQLKLIRMLNEETVLASCGYAWPFGETRQLSLKLDGSSITGLVDGEPLLSAEDTALDRGGIALLVEGGRTASQKIRLQPVKA
jgi:hypothetical protein